MPHDQSKSKAAKALVLQKALELEWGLQGLSPGPGYSLRPRVLPGKGLNENC